MKARKPESDKRREKRAPRVIEGKGTWRSAKPHEAAVERRLLRTGTPLGAPPANRCAEMARRTHVSAPDFLCGALHKRLRIRGTSSQCHHSSHPLARCQTHRHHCNTTGPRLRGSRRVRSCACVPRVDICILCGGGSHVPRPRDQGWDADDANVWRGETKQHKNVGACGCTTSPGMAGAADAFEKLPRP